MSLLFLMAIKAIFFKFMSSFIVITEEHLKLRLIPILQVYIPKLRLKVRCEKISSRDKIFVRYFNSFYYNLFL